jgi:succinate dehydrogenase/fumarate reductase flavoprotein subunit
MAASEDYDVVVVGAGMAGLCASIAALESGARVLTIDKGSRVGGSMVLAGGLVWAFDAVAHLDEHMPSGNRLLQELVICDLPDSLAWLEGHGPDLAPSQAHKTFGRGRRLAPTELAPLLARRVAELGGRIQLRTGLIGLTGDAAGINGVRAAHTGQAVSIAASRVVLATGGFQGNVDLLTRYVTPYADRVYLRANPWSTGDGFDTASAVGAAVTPWLDWFYGHAMPAPPARFGPQQFYDVSQKYGQYAVALNLDGNRFADESAGTGEEVLNWSIARQQGATAVYIVDDEIANRQAEGRPLARISIERAAACGGPVVQAASIEELCGLLADWGIPPTVALATLRTYNEALRTDDDTLRPARRANRYPLAKPPFTAVLVRTGITFTGGGLLTDDDMRVLSRATSSSALPLVRAEWGELDYLPIPNLFAAGCDVGGVHAYGYMGGLATALVTGRRAGKAATGQS